MYEKSVIVRGGLEKVVIMGVEAQGVDCPKGYETLLKLVGRGISPRLISFSTMPQVHERNLHGIQIDYPEVLDYTIYRLVLDASHLAEYLPMSWEQKPLKRGFSCNSELLKEKRRERRWTQEDLADASHFSVRLIAKAESGGTLDPDTIAQLADALSTSENPLYPEDLICDPKKLVLDFLHSLKTDRGEVVEKCRHFLHDDIEFTMAGDPEVLPFAGKHVGIEAMDRACRTFFDFIEIIDEDVWQTEFILREGTEVVVGQRIMGQKRGLAEKGVVVSKPIVVVNRVIFERGKMISFDDYFNTAGAEEAAVEQLKLLAEAEQNGSV